MGAAPGITLERSPLWPGARPAFDEIHAVAILDANAAEIAFQAGQIDVTHVPMTAVPRLRSKLPASAGLITRPGPTYWWLGMQMRAGLRRHPGAKGRAARGGSPRR